MLGQSVLLLLLTRLQTVNSQNECHHKDARVFIILARAPLIGTNARVNVLSLPTVRGSTLSVTVPYIALEPHLQRRHVQRPSCGEHGSSLLKKRAETSARHCSVVRRRRGTSQGWQGRSFLMTDSFCWELGEVLT